jgi:hypothetical protein
MFSAVSNPGDERTTGMRNLAIRMLESRDVKPISAAFSDLGWNKHLTPSPGT